MICLSHSDSNKSHSLDPAYTVHKIWKGVTQSTSSHIIVLINKKKTTGLINQHIQTVLMPIKCGPPTDPQCVQVELREVGSLGLKVTGGEA